MNFFVKFNKFVIVVILLVITLLNCSNIKTSDFLTQEEIKWLNENNFKIKLAPDPGWAPIEFFDENGMYQGIGAEYFSLIEHKLNFKFKLTHLKDWNEILKQAKAGTVDLLGGAIKTEERSEYLLFTKPFLTVKNIILVRKKYPGSLTLSKLKGIKTAVIKGHAVEEYLKNKYNFLDIDFVKDDITGLRKLSFGEVDAMIIDLPSACWYLEKEKLSNLRVAGDANFNYNLSIAVLKKYPILHRILDKVLSNISKEEKDFIYDKWISIEYKPFYENKKFIYILTGAILFIFALFGFIIIWNRMLQKMVEQKTFELNQYKNHLEELVESRTAELTSTNVKLQKSLLEVKRLNGLLPICASCKKIRDDNGYWDQIEKYIEEHSEAEFSHSLCPECADKLYGDQEWYKKNKK